MLDRRGFLAGAVAALGAGVPLSGHASALDRTSARHIRVSAYPFAHFSAAERERRDFGKLTFLGGLELRSDDPDFGGISSLVMEPDGRGFIAISDRGSWITGRFTEANGVLAGIEAARITPMLGPSGRRLKETRYFDTESLARAGRTLYVGVERANDILQFDLGAGPNPLGVARGRPIAVPQGLKQLRRNAGIEALGVIPAGSPHAGALLALAEKAPEAERSGNNPGFITGPGGGRLSVRKIGDFDITDLAFLPRGDLLILERRFVPLFGLGFRIRRVALAAIRPGALLDGEVLIEADLAQQIDNMEALGLNQAPDGRVILTLMSDDNFSLLQRNLVLRFAMRE
jgi:hypothetical protein